MIFWEQGAPVDRGQGGQMKGTDFHCIFYTFE